MYQKKDYIGYVHTSIDLLKDLYERLVLISNELKAMGYSAEAFTISRDAEKLNERIDEMRNNLTLLKDE